MVVAMQQQSNNRVTFGPRSGLTEEEARDIRVRALRFVLDCYDRKKAACPGGPDDAEDLKNDRTTSENYTQ